jgi:hypothetical protein
MPPAITNCLTIDVEDYFQVIAFAPYVRQDQWDSFPLRVGDNTHRILDIPGSYNIKATFFVLGWVAEYALSRDREIHQHGLKIAYHCLSHKLIIHNKPRSIL